MHNTLTHDREIRFACINRILTRLYPRVRSPLRYRRDYEFLFAVILSAQTADAQVNKITPRLFRTYPSLDTIAHTEPPAFARHISSLNYYKTKARHIVASAIMLKRDFKGHVPRSIRELTTLSGVGRKSANVVMSELWGEPEGIAVDTHVARLAHKYKLTSHTDPLRIERDLMEIVPRREWGTFPLRLIFYGREYCPARCSKCPHCPLWQCVPSVPDAHSPAS